MVGEHGGRREGAGRKPKDRSGQERFEDAEAYLLAVVQGRTPPDAVRVTAAKTLIAYQKAKQRAPIKSPAPTELRKKTLSDIETSIRADFERKAIAIREKLKSKKGGANGKIWHRANVGIVEENAEKVAS